MGWEYGPLTLQQSNGLFMNYADGQTGNNFDDAASSALLAATVYRLAVLTGKTKFVSPAELTRAALFTTNGTAAATFSSTTPSTSAAQSSSTTSTSTASASSSTPSPSNPFADMSYFTSDGWLQPVVDPLNVGAEGSHSPEGQAFVLMLQAAWRDWTAAGSPGLTNSALPSRGRARDRVPVLVVLGLVVACTFGDHLFV